MQLLNEALATEVVCVLRYKRHYFTAKGLASQRVAEEFLDHAKEEEQPRTWISSASSRRSRSGHRDSAAGRQA